MGFSRQEYWSGLPFPSPGDLPDPGNEPSLLHCRQIRYHVSYREDCQECPFKQPSLQAQKDHFTEMCAFRVIFALVYKLSALPQVKAMSFFSASWLEFTGSNVLAGWPGSEPIRPLSAEGSLRAEEWLSWQHPGPHLPWALDHGPCFQLG